MKRGDLVPVVVPGAYGKPRPALVVQADLFQAHPSLTILPVTSELRDAPLFRIQLEPDEKNALIKTSQVMVDKIQTVPLDKVSSAFGHLEAEEMLKITRALAIFLGIA